MEFKIKHKKLKFIGIPDSKRAIRFANSHRQFTIMITIDCQYFDFFKKGFCRSIGISSYVLNLRP